MVYGLLINPLVMLGYWFGEGIMSLTNVAAGGQEVKVTPETILFNGLEITNINFFNSSGTDSFSEKLKTNIASWYYVMRTLAIIASLCVLLYIGIRMATSTLASDKAEYKRMLKDWLVGFALIFVLHYIIVLVVNGNDLIVNMLKEVMNSQSGAENGQLTNFLEKVSDRVTWEQGVSETLSATFVFLILVGITLAFLLMYLKRMIVVAFLIIIAPLITITYSIDKVGDNKSQALDAWLKEFVWTILIQPFHCVIYVVFVSIAVISLTDTSLSSAILAIMCMVFVLQAEDIVKKIFGIQADNIGKMSSSFAMAAGGAFAASKLAGKGAATTGKTVSKGMDKLSKVMPRTQNGTGLGAGIGKTASKLNSFSQKVANTVDSAPVQKGLKAFNNFMEDNKFGKALNVAGKAATTYANVGYKAASTMVGVAFSLPTAKGAQDIIAGGLTGYAAGQGLKSATKWVAKKGTTDVVEAGRTRNATNNLTESYKEMKKQDNLTENQMYDQAREYLKLDLESATAKGLKDYQQLFAYNLQVMMHQLSKAGADTSIDNILSRVNLKDIDKGNSNDNNQEQRA